MEDTSTEITPLPKMKLFVIATVVCAEAVSFSVIFPFAYFMVSDFGIADKIEDVPRYVGYLASAFALAQFPGNTIWGTFSDNFGRRRTILLGMTGNIVTNILFGLSQNYYWAVVARALTGLLNGNLGVGRTYLSEICDKTNQAKGFSITGVAFGTGLILGPLIGGQFSAPSLRISEAFPYLTPCLATSSIIFLGLILGIIYLEETLAKYRKTKDIIPEENEEIENNDIENQDDTESLISGKNKNKKKKKKLEKQNLELQEKSDNFNNNIKNKTVIVLGSIFGLIGFSLTVFVEGFTLWAATKYEDGGLSFDSVKIGYAISAAGFALFTWQLLFYARIEKKIGPLLFARAGLFGFAPILILLPTTRFLLQFSTILLWIALLFLQISRICAVSSFFTSIIILSTNYTEPRNRGKVNGITESLSSLGKSFSPAITGVLYSWSIAENRSYPFNYFFVFTLAGIIIYICFFLTFLLPSKVEPKQQGIIELESIESTEESIES